MNIISKHKAACIIVILAIGCIIYCLNVFTPLFCDDWHYAFIFGTHDRISSLNDIFISQYSHYFSFNGRYIVHSIVQLFDGILGKQVFNVCNTLMFITFLLALTLIVPNRKGNTFKIVSLAFILVFLMMAGFKYDFLWMSGSVNYLWVATAMLVFHHFLEKESVPGWAYAPLALLGFICGWSNEAFVVGLGAAYFVFFITHRHLLTGHRRSMLIAFYLGACLLVFAPGSVHRALYGTTTFRFGLWFNLTHMVNVRLLYVLMAIIVIKALRNKRNFILWIKKEQLFLMAVMVSFCFILLTGAVTEHSRFGIEFFSLILILRSIPWERLYDAIVVTADIMILAFACYVLCACHKCYVSNQEELAQITGDGCLVQTTQPDIPSFIHRFSLDYSAYDSEYDTKMYGELKSLITDYYGVRSITFLPKDFVEDIKANQDKYSCFRSFGELPFYAKKVSSGNECNGFFLEYEKPSYSRLPAFMHPLARIITGKPPQHVWRDARYVTIDGQRYALIHRTWTNEDHHLKKIIRD